MNWFWFSFTLEVQLSEPTHTRTLLISCEGIFYKLQIAVFSKMLRFSIKTMVKQF